MIVMKFGGTSVKDAQAMKLVIDIINKYISFNPIVVLSACSGITDKLLTLIQLSTQGNRNQANELMYEIEQHHQIICDELITGKELKELAKHRVTSLCSELKTLSEGMSLLRESTIRTQNAALAYGEILSSSIFDFACQDENIQSQWMDARQIIRVVHDLSNQKIDFISTKKNATELIIPTFHSKQLVITQGFIASGSDGKTTTLGRGGSDYSASILGAALNVQEIQIWTDVPGILTADPRIIPEAVTIPEMSFEEVRELSFYGAKVVHPDTIKPAIESHIPVKILCTFAPSDNGTLIYNKITKDTGKAKSVILKNDCSLISLITPNGNEPIECFNKLLNIVVNSGMKIYNTVSGELISNIIVQGDKETISSLLHNFEYELIIRDISILCVCGSFSNYISVKEKQPIIQKLLEHFPLMILYGSSHVSIISVFNPENSLDALKDVHRLCENVKC